MYYCHSGRPPLADKTRNPLLQALSGFRNDIITLILIFLLFLAENVLE